MTKIIGTHNGTFHCDEALAVFLLKQTNTYRDSDLKRTRDPAVLDTCDIVVDVGATYDESKQRFDHHQRGFTEVFGHGFETKLSSAGLVYKHFGKEVIANRIQATPDDPRVMTLWLKLYKTFIEAIDAIDNGIPQYPTDIKPKYLSRTNLSARVGWLNPAWNETVDSQVVDAQFAKASQLTGDEFMGRLDYYAKSWLPARDLVASAITYRVHVDPSGKILLLDQYAPWKEHLFELEAELSLDDEKNQSTSSTRTRLAERGASKPFPSPPRASRAAKRFLKHGEVFETMNYHKQQVLMAGYLFMRAGSSEEINQKKGLWLLPRLRLPCKQSADVLVPFIRRL